MFLRVVHGRLTEGMALMPLKEFARGTLLLRAGQHLEGLTIDGVVVTTVVEFVVEEINGDGAHDAANVLCGFAAGEAQRYPAGARWGCGKRLVDYWNALRNATLCDLVQRSKAARCPILSLCPWIEIS